MLFFGSNAHAVFGVARRPFFNAGNAAPIAGHPELRKAAEHSEGNREKHDEIPKIIAIVAQERHQQADDLRGSPAENRAHEQTRTALHAILRSIDSPKNPHEESQERSEAKCENRACFATAQRDLLQFFFFGLTADADIAAQDTDQIVDGTMDAEIRAHAVPVKCDLGLKFLMRLRLRQQFAELRAGTESHQSFCTRDRKQNSLTPLCLA